MHDYLRRSKFTTKPRLPKISSTSGTFVLFSGVHFFHFCCFRNLFQNLHLHFKSASWRECSCLMLSCIRAIFYLDFLWIWLLTAVCSNIKLAVTSCVTLNDIIWFWLFWRINFKMQGVKIPFTKIALNN